MKMPIKSAQSYRTPMKVTEILLYENGDTFSVCPQCRRTLDRDYQRYCDRCGQCLDWSGLNKAKIIKWSKDYFGT